MAKTSALAIHLAVADHRVVRPPRSPDRGPRAALRSCTVVEGVEAGLARLGADEVAVVQA
jgi:hypothetical protein